MTKKLTPDITVIEPKTAHQIEGWAIEVYRKNAPNYAIVAIVRGSRVLNLRRNKCRTIFATPEAAKAAWNVIDWDVTIDKNGAVYRVGQRSFIGFHAHVLNIPAPVAPDSRADVKPADVKLLPSGNQAIALLPARIVERIIALPTAPVAPIAPLALPSKVEYIGKHTYRITQHTARLISVEQLHPFVGIWQHVANYATSEQVDNFRARMIAEANRPAPREETYRMNSLYVEAYRVYGGGYVWRYKIRGASTRGFVFGSFASAEEALKAARAYVDSKCNNVRKGVLLNKGL